jgi:hypothetical protein
MPRSRAPKAPPIPQYITFQLKNGESRQYQLHPEDNEIEEDSGSFIRFTNIDNKRVSFREEEIISYEVDAALENNDD